MDRQNSLSLSTVTGMGWCFCPQWNMGPMPSQMLGWTGFTMSINQRRSWRMHLLHSMCQAALNATFMRGQLFHNHPSAVGPWNIISQQPPNTHVKAAQGCPCLLHPFKPKKLLLHFPRRQASRVCSLQFCCNPESSLKLWWFNVTVCSTQECFGFLTSDKASV